MNERVGPRDNRGPALFSGPKAWLLIRRLLPVAISCFVLFLWWSYLGPVSIGGRTTFAIVSGRSMEPTFQDGDLVIARVEETYTVGDVIVFPVEPRQVVIHRIIDGNAQQGWITQGDGNETVDSWTVPDNIILGKQWQYFPGYGLPLRWTQENPLLFGLIMAIVVLLTSFRVRLRRLHPEFRKVLADEGRRRLRAKRPPWEIALLALAITTTIIATVGLTLLILTNRLSSIESGILASIAVVSLLVALLFSKRLGDGWRVSEPQATHYVFSGRCFEVNRLPTVDNWIDCRHARELRSICDKKKLPALRYIDPTGDEIFMTMNRNGTGYRWRIPVPTTTQGSDSISSDASVSGVVPNPALEPQGRYRSALRGNSKSAGSGTHPQLRWPAMGLFKRAPKVALATEAELLELRTQVAQLTSQLSEIMTQSTESQRIVRDLTSLIQATESRITQVGSEVTNQLNELSGDIESLEQLTKQMAEITSELPADIELVRHDQEELAREQARYQIAFRQDLAEVVENLQKKR